MFLFFRKRVSECDCIWMQFFFALYCRCRRLVFPTFLHLPVFVVVRIVGSYVICAPSTANSHTHTNYFGSSLWSLVSYDEMLSRVNVCEIFAYMLYFSSSRRRSHRCCVRVCVCVVVGFHSCSVLLWCVLFCSVRCSCWSLFCSVSVLFLCSFLLFVKFNAF